MSFLLWCFFVPWICAGWIEPASSPEGYWIIRLEGVLGPVQIPQYHSGGTAHRAIPTLLGAETANCSPWNCSTFACLAWRCAVPVSASYLVALAAQTALVWASAVWRVKWLVLCKCCPAGHSPQCCPCPVPPRGTRALLQFLYLSLLFWATGFGVLFSCVEQLLSQGLHLY